MTFLSWWQARVTVALGMDRSAADRLRMERIWAALSGRAGAQRDGTESAG